MKKTLLTLMSCMVALFASAQEPIITLTAEVTDAERTFEFGSAVAEENKISIDWGDGTVVEGATITGVYDGWDVPTTSVTGTPKGSGEIKIYATGAICYFDCVSKVDGPGITTLDVSKATELTELYANGNKLTSFDGSKLGKLSKLYLNNNSLTEVTLPASLTYLQLANNKLTSFDGSNLTAVSSLYVSENASLTTLDVSGMSALKSLYALNCGLTSINVGALTTAKAFINVNGNLLETLDLSEATGLENGTLHARDNNLTEIKFPAKVKTANIQNNKFTLATVPTTANVTNLNYAPQQDMVIEDINETIDLSAQNNLTGFAAEAKATAYTWIAETDDTLKAGVDYTEEAGVFTFIKEQEQKVYCTMTTEALPKFTGTNVFKTVAVAVTPKASKVEFPYAGAYTGSIKLTHLQGEGSTLDAQVATISEAEGKFNVTFPSFNTMIGMATGEIVVEDVTITEKADGSYDLSKEKFTVGQGFVTYPYSSFTGTVYADGSVEMTVKVVQNPEIGALTTAVFSAEAAEVQTPVITLTAEVTDAERTFEFGSAVAEENKISIDWGDGTVVEGATITGVYDGWDVPTTSVTGTPKGSGEIKIYATGAICYFDCVSKVDGPGITTLDVSKATELTELYANGNKLTSFDGSKLGKLSKLYLNNNSLTEVTLPASLTYLQLANNKLTSFDGSNLTAVSSLYVSENASLTTLDVSGMSALKSLYALNCGLTSINVGALTTAKAFINVNGNLLETLDLSEATGLENGTLHARDNNLTEIKFPAKVKTANIQNNKFTLATVPTTANVTNLNYAPQQDMVIEDINETIDLSAQNNLTGFAAEAKATAYTWIAEDGTALVAGTDYTEEAGKFTFIKEQTQKVYCTMTTEALPKFTGANVFKTTAVAVTAVASGIENIEASAALVGDIYSVDGKLIKRGAAVSEMPKGLYIVKTTAGKAVKVVRK